MDETLFLPLQRTGRDSHHDLTGGNRFGDAGPGADHSIIANDDGLFLRAIDDDRPRAHVDTLPQMHAPGHVHARRQCSEITYHDIVPNRAVQVDLHVLAQGDVSSEDVASTDHCSGADLDPLRTLDPRVDDGPEAKTRPGCLLHQTLASLGRAHATYDSRVREPRTSLL